MNSLVRGRAGSLVFRKAVENGAHISAKLNLVGLRVAIAAAVLAGPAAAQTTVPAGVLEYEDAEFFRPTTDPGDYLTAYDSDAIPPQKFTLGVYGDYARNPLEIQFEEAGDRFSKLVRNLGTIQGIASIGVVPHFSLGLRIPAYVTDLEDVVSTTGSTESGIEFNLGDVVANGTVTLLSRSDSPVGLAIVPEITFPTGNRREFAGTGKFGYGGLLVIDGEPSERFRLGVNIGGLIRDEPGGGPFEDEDDNFNDQFRGSFGAAYDFSDRLTGIFETVAAADASDPFNEERKTPVDLLGALRWHLGEVDFTFGGGAGVTRGQGSPDFRVFVGLTPPKPPREPREAEGGDLGQSRKTLAVRDQDRDGRTSPGDILEYRIQLLNSGAGSITNASVNDPIPSQTRYVPGSLTIEGRPMTDAPGDDGAQYNPGPPAEVQFRIERLEPAPGKNEAALSFQVEIDREITSITTVTNQAFVEADNVDKFPLPAADVTVFPAIRETERVIVTPERLELTEDIHFEFDKAVIQRRSYSILKEVAKVLGDYPALRIRVEGNTDSVGTDSYNQKLSDRRALAVRDFLVGAGVDQARLDWVGRGEVNPIDTNETDTGRAKNRRTEFIVLNPEAIGKTVERKPTQVDLAPESEPEWLRRGERPID